MSVFRNVRLFPSHGSRSAVITWELADEQMSGDVFVAFSPTGTVETWTTLNEDTPVPSDLGTFSDTNLILEGGSAEGYYRLLLRTADDDFLSEPIAILGDLYAREYGMARGIMYQEFTMMRATNGYPVWHCIPKRHGTPAARKDPDTGEVNGTECPGEADASYGLPFQGGFYTPILTWIRPLTIDRGTVKDTPSEMTPHETDVTMARMLAWPRPGREHMIVDPATDRRYLIGDEVKPMLLRGIIPVAYEANLVFMKQSDPRYRFPVPAIDTKTYRKIPYWT